MNKGPDKERAVELVRKRVPVNKGEEAEAVAEVAGNEFVGQNGRMASSKRYCGFGLSRSRPTRKACPPESVGSPPLRFSAT